MARIKSDPCMFCGQLPCTCNAKVVKTKAQPRVKAQPVAKPTPVPVVHKPTLTDEEVIEITALKNLRPLMSSQTVTDFQMQLSHNLTPVERARAWRLMR